ncbi:hypothetical protein LLEC1_02203 [Akanthomyces lecanii]|uniref:CFEM domain-containing protein n=1 Tax=Cordyceps confragosa TaxID=2714763 RepID=A0A179I205_CORDF|nr:hypothetical protein LLEC1_02203 [Akanthomyces lecanii]
MHASSLGIVLSLSVVALGSSSASSPTPTTLQTTSTTGSARWALTTVFTEPTACNDGITALPGSSQGLWHNIVHPVPSLTLTSCYPDIFISSAVATKYMPPFEQLVCPNMWEAYKYNSTYVICCPKYIPLPLSSWCPLSNHTSLYGLYAPEWKTNKQRPGVGAVCTSRVQAGLYVDTWSYDSAGHSTLVGTTLGSDQPLLIVATAFDGTIATAVETPTSSTTALPTSSTSKTTSSSTPATTEPPTTSSSAKPTSTWSGATAVSQLPSCGQTCFGNMLSQYKALGCSTDDPACLCRNADFGNGIRDCSNGACGRDAGSAVIAFETGYYCPSAIAARTTMPTSAPTPTAISQLPECGQTCFKNMQDQYSQLGCSSPEASCLCQNPNFGYGLRDCSNGACGPDIGSTVIAFANNYYCAHTTPTL